MAKSVSFNKRELEKKKEQKRKEKQQRKEERKAGGVSSFDEMIAYVDENGMITDSPPDPGRKSDVAAEDIFVSTPKKEEIELEPLKGRVEHFNPDKGFGFIKAAGGGTDKFFFHVSNAPEGIAEGNRVTFEIERGQRGMNAVRIEVITG
jgi:cold shock CspA family protein